MRSRLTSSSSLITLWFSSQFYIILSNMKPFHDFRRMLDLEQDVLERVVKEGEAKLLAQLSVAGSADQRAISILSFLVGTTTAVVGATIAMLFSKQPNALLIGVAYLYAFLLLVAASRAVKVFRPKAFSFPGNEPENWLPDQWNFESAHERTAKHALVEQCYTLNQAICKNMKDMDDNAANLRSAINTAGVATVLAAALLATYAIGVLFFDCKCAPQNEIGHLLNKTT